MSQLLGQILWIKCLATMLIEDFLSENLTWNNEGRNSVWLFWTGFWVSKCWCKLLFVKSWVKFLGLDLGRNLWVKFLGQNLWVKSLGENPWVKILGEILGRNPRSKKFWVKSSWNLKLGELLWEWEIVEKSKVTNMSLPNLLKPFWHQFLSSDKTSSRGKPL